MLPDGYGLRLEAGSTLTYNMHYHKDPGEGTGIWTQPEIAFFVEERPVQYKVVNDSIGNTGFEIPPGHPNYRIGMSRTLEQDIHVLTYWPHAHLRGSASRYTAFYPDGREELLLDVPHYDQGWQETYKYSEPKLLPEGTRIDISFWYDNSPERAARSDFDRASRPATVPGPTTRCRWASSATPSSSTSRRTRPTTTKQDRPAGGPAPPPGMGLPVSLPGWIAPCLLRDSSSLRVPWSCAS